MSYYKYIIKTPKNQQNTTEDAGHEKKQPCSPKFKEINFSFISLPLLKLNRGLKF